MTEKDFKILQALQYEGFVSGMFDFVSNIESTREYFGTNEDMPLCGYWLAVWDENNSNDRIGYTSQNTTPIHADIVLSCDSQRILLFRFDNPTNNL